MADREPRATKTREKTERKTTWKRPSALPDPDQQAGVEYRWIRTSTLGAADNKNVPDVDSKFDGNVEVGGLLLCKTSTENVEARREYFADQNAKAMEAVDNNYLRDSDPRMPLLRPEKTTRTT